VRKTIPSGFGRWVLRTGLAGLVVVQLLTSSPCSAQTTPTATPFPAPMSPVPVGDLGYVAPFSGFRLSAPLRLSLMSSVDPMASGFPNCASREDAAGNSVGHIPIQHYTEWRLVPRLVLSAFTQLGCPIDGGMGAVATYAVPLRPSSSLSLVVSAGAYVAPAQFRFFGGVKSSFALGLKGANSPAPAAARADLVWKGPGGDAFNVGTQSQGRTTRITFGGAF